MIKSENIENKIIFPIWDRLKEVSLQYISQGKTPQDHIQNIQKVCKAGGKWIQLRLKDVDTVTYLNTALECRNICDQYEAIMIINDSVAIAKATLADGVHLGLKDTSISEARKILGDSFIIGGTANTIEDCMQHLESGVDYIGLGPFKYTTTKKKLEPILGLRGYRNILYKLKNQNVKVPIIAIGGIIEQDIEDLMKTGVSGIAVSKILTGQKELNQNINNIKTLITQANG